MALFGSCWLSLQFVALKNALDGRAEYLVDSYRVGMEGVVQLNYGVHFVGGEGGESWI